MNLTAALIDISAARDWVEMIKNIYISIKAWWKEVTKTQAKYYNKKVKCWEYAEEDYVWLTEKNIYSICFNKKLNYKYHDLYYISDIVKKQAYCLELIKIMKKIHSVFHVLLLKPYHVEVFNTLYKALNLCHQHLFFSNKVVNRSNFMSVNSDLTCSCLAAVQQQNLDES